MRIFCPLLTILVLIESHNLFAAETNLIFPDGKYQGEVANGIPHGRGVFIWNSDGGLFDGNWVNGKMHGHGTYTSKSGESTALFYEQGELAVDYQALPKNYISSVCQLTSNLFVGEVDDYMQLSSELTAIGTDYVVEVSFHFKKQGVPTEGNSVCKFRRNEKLHGFEMIEARIDDIVIAGEEARKTGQTMERILFIPDILQ